MSKSALILGLMISVIIHLIFLWPGTWTKPLEKETMGRSVSVVELPTVAALPEEAEELPTIENEMESETESEPEPESQPEPNPAPVAESISEPEPAKEVELAASTPLNQPPAETPRPATQPLEPIMSAPPLPVATPLESVAQGSRTAFDGPGDFAAAPDGPLIPALWIDWGSPQEALNILTAGGMQLVVLESDESIRYVVSLASQEPTLAAWRPDRQARFSNRLRIVDHVSAFSSIARSLSLPSGTHLAVLFPMRIDQLVDTAQRRAAFDEGAAMDQIRGFAGHFTIAPSKSASHASGSVSFLITHLQRR